MIFAGPFGSVDFIFEIVVTTEISQNLILIILLQKLYEVPPQFQIGISIHLADLLHLRQGLVSFLQCQIDLA